MLDERRLTWLLAALILAGGGLSLWPRVRPRLAPFHLEASGMVERAARVSLNRAALSQLEALPGVGPTLARRIVAHRPYLRVEDLKRVPGIGEKLYRRLLPLIEP